MYLGTLVQGHILGEDTLILRPLSAKWEESFLPKHSL